MSLDALLTLLFVVVFVVLPLVSRVLRERNRQGGGSTGGEGAAPTGGAGGTPGGAGEAPPWLVEAQRRVREARGGAEASTAQPPQAQPPGGQPAERPPSGGRPPADARRPGTLVPEDPFHPVGRPRRTTSGPLDPSAERSPTLVPEEPFGSPLERPARRTLVPEDPFERGLAGAEEAGRAGPGLGREGTPPTPAGASRRRGGATAATAAERRVEAGMGAAAYGRPHRRAGSARLRLVGSLRFEREAVVTGLIWHEILDEPAWKRRRGRALSRRRSR